MLRTEALSGHKCEQKLNFLEVARVIRPRTRAKTYNGDKKVHASQKLEAVHHEAFGRALESEAGDELTNSVYEGFAGESEKILRRRNAQSSSFSASEIKEAVCGVTRTVDGVVELTRKVSIGTYRT